MVGQQAMPDGIDVDLIKQPKDHFKILVCFACPCNDVKIFTAVLQYFCNFAQHISRDSVLNSASAKQSKVLPSKSAPAAKAEEVLEEAAANPAGPVPLNPFFEDFLANVMVLFFALDPFMALHFLEGMCRQRVKHLAIGEELITGELAFGKRVKFPLDKSI